MDYTGKSYLRISSPLELPFRKELIRLYSVILWFSLFELKDTLLRPNIPEIQACQCLKLRLKIDQTKPPSVSSFFGCTFLMCVYVCVFSSQGHPAGKSKRSALSLAAQLLLCQQPLLIPGLFLHCVVVYYAVLAATPPHPSPRSSALHPLLCTVVGRGPWLTHTPYQPLNFVEHKV